MQEVTKRRPGRPAGHHQPEEETRALIVHAAAELFSRRGYAAVAIGDIAAAVGVTKATLYYHFSGKEAIYAEVMCWTLTEIAAGIRAIADAPEPIRARLLTLGHRALASAPPEANLDAMMRDVAEHLTPPLRLAVAGAHEALLAAYDELMQSGIARGELQPIAPRLLAHAFQHLLEAFVGVRGADFPDRAAAVTAAIELFLEGAAAREIAGSVGTNGHAGGGSLLRPCGER